MLDGQLTVELDGKTHTLKAGDLISYEFGAEPPHLEPRRAKGAGDLGQSPAAVISGGDEPV